MNNQPCSKDRMNYSALVDIPKLQALLDSLSQVTGLANGVLDVDGKIIAFSGWQDACAQFHRINSESCNRCLKSDTSLVKQTMLGREFAVYDCLNGLMDVAAPIMIEGQHIASVFAGQFLTKPPDLDFFRRQARHFGFDEEKYLAAIARIPVISLESVETHTQLYAQLAATLAENGIDRVKQNKATVELLCLNAELGKRIEERTRALAESEERLRLALGAARLGWFDMNVQTGVVIVAPEYADLLGYDPSTFITSFQQWIDNIHPDDSPAVLAAFQAGLETGNISSLVYRRKGGAAGWVWIESMGDVVNWDKDGTPLRMIGIHKDITERKQLEGEATLLRKLVEFCASPVYAVDMDDGLRMMFVNRAACEHYGMTREELLKMRVPDWDPLFTPEKVEAFKTELMTATSVLHFETLHRRNDGRLVPVEITAGHFSYQGKNVSSGFILNITERKQMEEKIRKLAYLDPLTSLPNRRLLLDRLAQALARAKRYQLSFAIMFLDLDNFKQINDTLGHDVGDDLLNEVAVRLSACVRNVDTVSRPGGDEFIIVLSEITHPDDAALVAEKIIKAINVPVQIADNTLYVTTSIGIAVYPISGNDNAQELMMKADKSMYSAKKSGGNAYQFFTE